MGKIIKTKGDAFEFAEVFASREMRAAVSRQRYFFWAFTLEPHWLAGQWMRELQFDGVQSQSKRWLTNHKRPVLHVAENRMPQLSQVDANLIRPSRFQPAFEQRLATSRSQRLHKTFNWPSRM